MSGNLHGAGGVGGLLAMKYNGESYFYVYDGNGNVRALVKANAANPAASSIIEKYNYDGFGRELPSSAPITLRQSPFAFSTKYLDAETGMNYYGYRFYAADAGHWVNRDPIWEEGGLNIYVIAGNNAILYSDINGLAFNDLGETYDLTYDGSALGYTATVEPTWAGAPAYSYKKKSIGGIDKYCVEYASNGFDANLEISSKIASDNVFVVKSSSGVYAKGYADASIRRDVITHESNRRWAAGDAYASSYAVVVGAAGSCAGDCYCTTADAQSRVDALNGWISDIKSMAELEYAINLKVTNNLISKEQGKATYVRALNGDSVLESQVYKSITRIPSDLMSVKCP